MPVPEEVMTMTTAQPDDAASDRRSGGHSNSEEQHNVLESWPPDTPLTWTEEPLWVLASIVLGLVALTGSIVALVLTAIAGLFVFLAHVSGGEAEPGRNRFGGPINGPGVWP